MKKFIDFKSLLLILGFCAYLAIFCSGCASAKRCNQKFLPQVTAVIKDSIREVIQYRDTTIFIHLEPITIFKTDTIYLKNGVIQFREVKASSNYATARAWLAMNRINLTLTDKDTTLELRLNNALKTARYYEMKYNTETKIPEPEKFVPGWVKILAWIGGISFLLLLLALLRKFKIV